MAMTLRLKPLIEARAKAHAESVGISVNALVALALDHYLAAQDRKTRSSLRPASIPTTDTPKAAAAAPIKPASGPKLGRNDPCWCGSGVKYKRCHGAASA